MGRYKYSGNYYSSVYFPHYLFPMQRTLAGKRGLSSQGKIFLNERLDVTVSRWGSPKVVCQHSPRRGPARQTENIMLGVLEVERICKSNRLDH